ncbi:MAG: 5-formyltetrahydrofolate cyclo-ligase, partial [Schleiferiaceae bacterium]|nr:5-formyltetrahydrofolate cyclo-ligase [Schleiferiaceae bacterium]
HPGSDKQYDGPIDTFIIPGLAFDIQKNRLGYGAGYFDRFLKNYSTAQKIAVALPFQIMKQLPAESHDVPMDLIIVPEKN